MLDIVTLPHFFHLKEHAARQFKQNLFHILTLLLAFLISVLLTSSNFISVGISSDFMWEERKFSKTLNPSRIFDTIFGLPFWPAFTLSIHLPIILFWSSWTLSQISFFSMSSLVVEWCCAYSTLPFCDSRDDRITLVAE